MAGRPLPARRCRDAFCHPAAGSRLAVAGPGAALAVARPGQSPDFAAGWPGEWQTIYPTADEGTTWHLWQGEPPGRGRLCLAGVHGGDVQQSRGRDEVSYTNNAEWFLQSLPAATARAVRIVHAIAGELSRGRGGLGAGVIEFGLPDGSWLAAMPLGGYAAASRDRTHALARRPAFAAVDRWATADRQPGAVDLVPVLTCRQPCALATAVRERPALPRSRLVRGASGPRVPEVPEAAFPVAFRVGGCGSSCAHPVGLPWGEAAASQGGIELRTRGSTCAGDLAWLAEARQGRYSLVHSPGRAGSGGGGPAPQPPSLARRGRSCVRCGRFAPAGPSTLGVAAPARFCWFAVSESQPG